MTLKQKILQESVRKGASETNMVRGRNETTFQRVHHFHDVMGLPVAQWPVTPTVSERILRGKLMLEEVMEFIYGGLGLTLVFEAGGSEWFLDQDSLVVTHEEGHKYDPVETLDGISDIKVIADGTGVAFGLPVDAADWEIYASNMSKLDESGKPVVNDCIKECVNKGQMTCENPLHYNDPSKPQGKLLKGEHYTPANMVRVIVESQPDEQKERTYEWLLNTGS